jgi:hypothetical protein
MCGHQISVTGGITRVSPIAFSIYIFYIILKDYNGKFLIVQWLSSPVFIPRNAQ